jgi:hypothetical protein
MIERVLRNHLQPLVQRRQRLHMARRLGVCWLACAGLGLILLGLDWLWAWHSPWAVGAWGVITVTTTAWTWYRTRQFRPDYQAMARTIEEQHPEARALILAAVEQEPQGLGGQLGYLQKGVIKEAVIHATCHDWERGVPTWRLIAANMARVAALLLLMGVLSQMLPSLSVLPPVERGVLTRQGVDVSVTPGDTTVESGAPVVIAARFNQRVPDQVTLVYGAPDQAQQRVHLSKNLNDPVFGGMIPEVLSNLVYHVEYGGKRSRAYTISIYEHPRLVQADAHIVYPAYTELAQRTIADTRKINVIEGSQVSFKFVLNKAVLSARLAPKQGVGPELVIDKDYPNVLHMRSLTAQDTQRLELHLTDAQGMTNKVPPRLVIQVHRNLPPELKPVFPKGDIQASPLEELALEAEVQDDYGLTGFGLSYRLAGTPNRNVTMDVNDQKQIQYLLALEDLQAAPDQLLSYHFWAEDIGPDGQARRTTSDMYFAELRPFDEIFRESESRADERNQQQQREQQDQAGADRGAGDELAPLQKQIIIATWNTQQQVDQRMDINDIMDDLEVVRSSQADALANAGSALTEAQDASARQALQAATQFMTTALDRLTQAATSDAKPDLLPALDAEQSAYQELLRLRQREHQITQARNGNRSGRQNSARNQQLSQLELKQREDRYETQSSAQPQREQTQREDLQVLNRLRDLARRQEEMNRRLKEAQASLNQAQNAAEQEEVTRELKRLRDEQQQSVRDLDELQQRMEEPQNRRRMADARQRLEQSRSGMRSSSQELQQGRVSSAINSSTRVQRELEDMRDELQQQTSSQFSEEMRDMRNQARQLDQQQEEISEEISQQADAPQKRLVDTGVNRELAERLGQQQEQAADLIERMKEVSEASEASEPLLSQKLYDTLRRASTDQVDQGLEAAEELVRRNFLPQAQRIERRAGQGIDAMREGVEEAAQNVLGNEAEALRQARQQLDDLIQQLDEEQARAAAGDPNGVRDRAGAREPNVPATVLAMGVRMDPNALANAPADPNEADPRTARPFERGGGGGATGPFTGQDYRPWSDSLREVEEMLDEPELRNEAARVRDRARAVRTEYLRYGQAPQWDLVRMQITGPLMELRKQVSDSLARLQSDRALVPIDRDPVPGRYAELVRRYFETLGDANQ